MSENGNIDLIKRLYVEQGRSLTELAVTHDVAMPFLRARCDNENWDELRANFKQQTAATDANDTLAMHEGMLRRALLELESLMTENQNKGMEAGEARALGYRIENQHKIVEALTSAIDSDRTVRGVKKSAPSVPKDVADTPGVAYKVTLKREEQAASQ